MNCNTYNAVSGSVARAPRRRRHGFTLIEILVTIVIASLVITAAYSVVVTTVDAKLHVEERTKASRAGPAILGVISEDLRGAVPPLTGREVFIGGPGDPNENNGGFLRLTTSAEPAFFQTKARNTLIEVTYYIKHNRGEQPRGLFSLYRGERTLQNEGGSFRLLYDRVRRISLRYRPPTGDPLRHWTIDLQSLPMAVEIELEIEAEAKEKKQEDPYNYPSPSQGDKQAPTYTFTVLVSLPSGGTVSEELVFDTQAPQGAVAAAPEAGGSTSTTGAARHMGGAGYDPMMLHTALQVQRALATARIEGETPETMNFGALEERARRAFGSNWRTAYERYIPR